ncbi:MAG: hypothetical protein KAQ63_01520 [Candidatus Moranbacteria bacterium]|nr:hypothetical protein [Candidatus Moranbacteria bacterium]
MEGNSIERMRKTNGKEEVDLKNQLSVNAMAGWNNELASIGKKEGLNDNSQTEKKERGPEKERAQEWADQFLPDGVLDAYALFYEKSKKSDEVKRGNKKYQKYLEMAETELKPKLVSFLEKRIEEGRIKIGEENPKNISKEISEILKSDMHAKSLLKAMNKYQNDPENKEKTSSGETVESIGADKTEISLKEKGESEAFEAEKEFFEKYKKGVVYINSSDGSEVTILDYDLQKKKATISVYRTHLYNTENDAHEFVNAKEKKEVTLEELENLLKNSFTDEEMEKDENKQLKKEKKELEKAFWEEFEKYKNIEGLKIVNFGYVAGEKRHLAKIKEGGNGAKLVTKQELREVVEKLSAKKLENDNEKLNETEEKLVEIFGKEVLEYKQKVVDWAEEIFSKEETKKIVKEDLVNQWVKGDLLEMIKNALVKNNIKNASVDKIQDNRGARERKSHKKLDNQI